MCAYVHVCRLLRSSLRNWTWNQTSTAVMTTWPCSMGERPTILAGLANSAETLLQSESKNQMSHKHLTNYSSSIHKPLDLIIKPRLSTQEADVIVFYKVSRP